MRRVPDGGQRSGGGDVAARFHAQRGYRVLVAQDVTDALRIGRTHPRRIDLLLTDIVMPTLNGPDLAQRIVEWRPSMRVLYVSGYTEALGPPIGTERITVVRKPFTSEALASAVRQASTQTEALAADTEVRATPTRPRVQL